METPSTKSEIAKVVSITRQTTRLPGTIICMQEPNRAVILLKQIWPTIYRGINGLFYFLFGIIRTGFKIAIQQLKGGGE